VEKNYCPGGECAVELVHDAQGYLLGYINDIRYDIGELSEDANGLMGAEDRNYTKWNAT